MAIVSSGTISLQSLQNEFGGSNPIGINEYYAAAGLVPSGTINGSGSAIPTSGQVSLSTFYGSQQVPTSIAVRVLIVGGGGSGLQRNGGDNNAENGAGGGGGYVDASFNLPKGTYGFTIGGGGYGGNGGGTVAFGYTANGGGYGGGSDSGPGGDGGSGGGAAERTGSYGSSNQPKPTSGNYGNMPAYGNNGSGGPHGGGGGAGAAANGGYGGAGKQWINGSYYGAGGGSSYGYSGGTGGGGSGPGGAGSYYGAAGGGSYGNPGPQAPTYGYQGIVIVSYQWNFQVMSGGSVSSSGSGMSTTWYHAITSSAQQLIF